MPRNLNEVADESKARRGSKKTFTEDALNAVAVFDDTWRDILTQTSTESAKYYHGQGMRSRDDPNLGYMYADLQNSTPAAIDGTFRWVVYQDSEDEVPIVGPSEDSRDMRDAAALDRTERPAMPLLLPGAGKDKKIAVQFQADSASDGESIAPANCDVLIPYSSILE